MSRAAGEEAEKKMQGMKIRNQERARRGGGQDTRARRKKIENKIMGQRRSLCHRVAKVDAVCKEELVSEVACGLVPALKL